METYDLFMKIVPNLILRGGFAIVCGGLIGIERERKGKPAGFRTNTLICLGSALYMLVSEYIIDRIGITGIDPTRIAAQVVTGIGFLGAGTIIQSRGTITGLTSAATIWVVAAIGILIGAGFPWIGLLCTLLVLLALSGLTKIEPMLLGKCHFVTCDIVFADDGGQARAELAAILAEHDISPARFDFVRVDEKSSKLTLQFCDKHPAHSRFMTELWRAPGVLEVSSQKQPL